MKHKEITDYNEADVVNLREQMLALSNDKEYIRRVNNLSFNEMISNMKDMGFTFYKRRIRTKKK